MTDFLGGTDVVLTVAFGTPSDPVVPDVGSAKYTLRDHTGQALASDVAITTGSTSFQATLTIDAANNTIDASRVFERRSISLSFQLNGATFQKVVGYRLIPAINYSVQPQDVRSFIGVNENELGDDDLDVFGAYLMVRDDVTDEVLAPALISGTAAELAANTMVRMRAVMQAIPGLMTRVAQSEKNGVMGFARPTIVDFTALAQAAQDAYDTAKIATIGQTVITDLVFFQVTQDTDVITGA